MTEIFIDGKFAGKTKKPEELINKLRTLRRTGKISEQINFSHLDYQDTLFVNSDPGRARRPLIVVEDGKPKLTKQHLEDIKNGVKKWSDLLNEGVIEYIDAEEEENIYVALRPENITKKHTHLELDPIMILGVSTSFIPFPEFNRGDRVNFGSKMVGQAIGLFLLNFPRRVDTKSNVMVYPQSAVVNTHINDVINTEDHPGGQNVIIGVMCYKGFNMEDSIILNKASIERGLLWSYLFRTYESEEKRYMGGQEDMIGVPEPGVRGYGGEDAYKHLPEDGIADPETKVESEQVIVGKSSPLRFLGGVDQFITGLENIRETSIKLRHGEKGIVDRVFITESSDGNKLIKLVIRDLKRPELGDKLASRHGQKGVIGLIIPQEDMPFSKNGTVPDLLFNPIGIPSRMTMGKLLEILAGKVASLSGERLKSPAFHPLSENELRKKLKEMGYDEDGKETLYNGETGAKFQERIYTGTVFYQKLDHLVSNKMHARSRGPNTLLTKQPTEGKSKRGGLRLGEMEKDALLAHGSTLLLKERLDSDRSRLPVCKSCGLFAVEDRIKNKKYCPICKNSKIIEIEISYAFKLLLDELKSMLIYPKIVVDQETQMIDKIIFGVLEPGTVRKMSVAKLNKTDLYDQEGYPIEGGLMDPRLGIIDPGLRCRTCGGSTGDCKGHFGHLELTRPVVNVNYAKLIYNILRLTCRKCNKILLNQAGVEKFKKGKKSLKILRNLIKSKCPHCGERQKKVKFIKPTTYTEGGSIISPVDVRERLGKIKKEDLAFLGFKNTRPENFIITLLPIPPVTMRPSITLETGERSEDDLTHKLVDIVRINKRLRENIDLGAPEFIIQDLWELLQYHVATYISNEISGVPPARHRSGRVLKTLTQRLKGKDGRFRHNLLGKRVDYSARTVISPDTMLDIDEVGIPLAIAEEITIPVAVTEKNLEHSKKLILNYPDWPTVNYVLRPDGGKKKITDINKEDVADKLEVGYIIERQLQDGDWTIFNRQPTLHRMGMMGHKVRVMPFKTFRLNTLNCPPYNADFDGDEMNLHIPQNIESQVEVKLLANSTMQIRSPRFSGPIIGASKDHIAGLFLLTDNKLKLSKEDVVDIVRFCDLDLKIPNKKTFEGKDLFSLFLPKDFNFEYKDKSSYVKIKNGKLISGSVGSRGLGAFKGKILDEIDKKYGHSFTKKFMFDVTRVCLEVLTRYGFSVSISGLDLPEDVHKDVEKIISKTRKNVDKLIENFHKGKIKPIIGRTPRESLETMIKKDLADALNEVTKIVKKKIPETSIVIMAKSGARGSIINIVQASCLIGQETVKGERISIGFHDRTFSHFKKGDINLESKGFVKNGYKQGLSPFEFFFDAMNSREGLMDKSLKTRHSGYLERRLIGALKDLKVEYDSTVRDSDKKIIQFIAGEDGLDPSKIKKGGINVEEIAEEI